MGGSTKTNMKTTLQPPPSPTTLQTQVPMRRRWFNRIFALTYTLAFLALLYWNFLNLIKSPSTISFLMLLADSVFAFMAINFQGYLVNPIHRQTYPDNVEKVAKEKDYMSMDVFICTADPYKEPPIVVVNTALSVMAYDYPKEKLTIYVSDDGGSQLTLFALMEAAKFARYWLPYCKKYDILERCPEAYFGSNPTYFQDTDDIKAMYENIKIRITRVVERGAISSDYIIDEQSQKAFDKWTDKFTRQEHPPVIQVLLESGLDNDVLGNLMPNLVYISREKSKLAPHHFKAGALNVLLRVSSTMTNAPIILTVDCDMYSNDPKTALRSLCYFMDPSMNQDFAFIQFPQLFHGINKNDIYHSEYKYEFQINDLGADGLLGPMHHGTGCFFRRRSFYGPPSSLVSMDTPELSPLHIVTKPITSEQVLTIAHHVAGCHFEAQTKWGEEAGFRYGTLVEDLYTGYRLHCEGWRTIFCYPARAAFLGDIPITLDDVLTQTKRWSIGFLEMGFSKYSQMTYGLKCLNIFQALIYMNYAFWAFWAIPVTIYAFLPQLALINHSPIFPKVSDPWFLLHVFLFLGANGQDFLQFRLGGGTVRRWWNSQRMWMARGLSCFLFASFEFLLKSAGISTLSFSVTSKVVDNDLSKRYEQGMFEFGVASPLFVPITMAALINLVCLLEGIIQVFRNGGFEQVFGQIFIAGFVVVNCWPVYEAVFLRSDKGKMPFKITWISILLSLFLYSVSSFLF